MICQFCNKEIVLASSPNQIYAYYVDPNRTEAPISKYKVKATKGECVTSEGFMTLHNPVAV
jgi:hypothetical protein